MLIQTVPIMRQNTLKVPAKLFYRRLLWIIVGLLLFCGLPAAAVYCLWQLDRHERALIVAVTDGSEARVEQELKWGVDPNTRAFSEKALSWQEYLVKWLRHELLSDRKQLPTALLLAEINKRNVIARRLLQAGADPNLTDAANKRPLNLAINSGDVETSLYMLTKGANPNTSDMDTETQTKTPALLTALARMEGVPAMERVARELIARGAAINVKTESGDTALMLAHASTAMTTLLLDKGLAKNIDAANNLGETALMLANGRVAKLMLEHSANPNSKDMEDETVLVRASRYEDYDKIRWLLKNGVDCRPAHNKNWNLLFWSAGTDRVDIVSAALARHMAVNARAGFQRTALMFAAARGGKNVTLLLAHGADVNAHDSAGMTALMYAAQEDDAATVQRLLHYGANPHLRDKEQGLTAAQRAKRFSCEDVVELFRTGHVPAKIVVNSKQGRVQVDADHWLVRTPLARKDDRDPPASEEYRTYRVCLVDNAKNEASPIVIHGYQQNAPKVFAFRDVDGRHYICIEGVKHYHYFGSAIYLVKKGELFEKWSGASKFGLSCAPLRHGGVVIRTDSPGHYKYGRHSLRTNDGVFYLARFRNGMITELGDIDTPSQ